jgi:glutathione S-transferase
MSPKYKLVYFDTKGRGEPVRMMFAYKGIQYEDKRVSHDGDDWKELKPSKI